MSLKIITIVKNILKLNFKYLYFSNLKSKNRRFKIQLFTFFYIILLIQSLIFQQSTHFNLKNILENIEK